MIAAVLLTGDGGWRALAIRVRLVTWGRLLCQLRGAVAVRIIYPPDVSGVAPLPADVFRTVVSGLSVALVNEFQARQGGRR